jgi:hypothetical protein
MARRRVGVLVMQTGNRTPASNEIAMKKIFSIAAIAAIVMCGVGAEGAELPSFELMGFPITPVQAQVLGASHVEERSPIPRLTLGGMPASPHQVFVLTPRSTIAADALNARVAKSGPSVP